MQQTIPYDETSVGKAAQAALKIYIEMHLIENMYGRLQNILTAEQLASLPKSLAEWTEWTNGPINFNDILRSLKAANYPMKYAPKSLKQFENYCKMRKLSVKLAECANYYSEKVAAQVAKGSTWASQLPAFICEAEPMTPKEYEDTVIYTQEYIREASCTQDESLILMQYGMRYINFI